MAAALMLQELAGHGVDRVILRSFLCCCPLTPLFAANRAADGLTISSPCIANKGPHECTGSLVQKLETHFSSHQQHGATPIMRLTLINAAFNVLFLT
jgi:hypothetical protein